VSVFTEKELAYLRSQPLGRLASVASDGQPDNAAVGFRVEDDGTIVITGMNLADSRKGRNVAAGNSKVALIVDDLESVEPWKPRGIRIFGEAELVLDAGRSFVRIVPTRSWSWDVEGPSMTMRAGGRTAPTTAEIVSTEPARPPCIVFSSFA